eukprot:scaffold76946_cov59-Phaeocystis_antarctica.AAC.2
MRRAVPPLEDARDIYGRTEQDVPHEPGDVALPDEGARAAIVRGELYIAPGARLDLVVRVELPARDEGGGLDIADVDGIERGVADPVPPGPQRDVLHGKLGEPCLSEIRRLARVEDLVPQR